MSRKTRAEIEEEEAQDYAWAIQNAGMIRPDWTAKNLDIMDRLSRSALLRIKRRAWQIVQSPEPARQPVEGSEP